MGSLVVRSYARGTVLTPEHLEILMVVARFVSEVVAGLWSTDSLQESESRFRSLAETAPCAIVIFDGDQLRYANSAARLLTGHADGDIQERSFWDIVHPDFRETVQNRAAARLAGRAAPTRFAFKVLRKDDEERWLDFSVGLIPHRGRTALLGVGVDVTEQKRAEQRMYALAYLDTLTGLPNRMLLMDRMAMALAEHRRLRKLARALPGPRRLQAGERLAGPRSRRRAAEGSGAPDPGRGPPGRHGRAHGRRRVRDPAHRRSSPATKRRWSGARSSTPCRRACGSGERDLLVHASMGIAIFPEDGTDAEVLLKNADAAMYRAKEAGRDTYQLHSKALHDAALERLELECDLRRALAERRAGPPLPADLRPPRAPARRLRGAGALAASRARALQPDEFLAVAERAAPHGAAGQLGPATRACARRGCGAPRRRRRI